MSRALLPPPFSAVKKLETPCYVYQEGALEELHSAFSQALRPSATLWHFALKANNNPHLLAWLKKRGAGLDIVSGGELDLARKAGFKARQILFSGVGKSDDELQRALRARVLQINVESRGEYERLARIAGSLRRKAAFSLRVNPHVDPRTHPHIATGLRTHKFGVDAAAALEIARRSLSEPALRLQGLSMHIGSQVKSLGAVEQAAQRLLQLAQRLQREGHTLSRLDLGGGLAVPYDDAEELPNFAGYGRLLERISRRWREVAGPQAQLLSECGRALVAQAGVLLTRVIEIKESRGRSFAIVDASMTELLRPALYGARHPIWRLGPGSSGARKIYEVVGPVCESADVLGSRVKLPSLKAGDLLAIGCAGAYGYVMASHYNARPLPAEYFLPAKQGPRLSRAARAAR